MNYSIWKNMKLSMIMLGLFISQCYGMQNDGIVESTLKNNARDVYMIPVQVYFKIPVPTKKDNKILSVIEHLESIKNINDIDLRCYDDIIIALKNNNSNTEKIKKAIYRLWNVDPSEFENSDGVDKNFSQCIISALSNAKK